VKPPQVGAAVHYVTAPGADWPFAAGTHLPAIVVNLNGDGTVNELSVCLPKYGWHSRFSVPYGAAPYADGSWHWPEAPE